MSCGSAVYLGDNMNKIIIGLIVLVVFATPGFAVQCLTDVDGTTSVTTNVTTGTNVQISVTPSGSCTGGEVTLQLTYTNCSLTINDPASPGYYTGVSTGTTKTFTVTSGSQDICTITARGTTTDGSVDDNTPVILEFIDPSTLTLAGAPSTATAAYGASFNMSINVSNSQSTDTLTSYELTLPTGLTRNTGDPTSSSSTTVYAGGTSVLSWTLTHTTCFTSGAISFQLGDNSEAFSATVTGNASCGSSGNGGSTPGGGSTGDNTTNGTSSTKETKLFSIESGLSEIISFTKLDAIGLTSIALIPTTTKTGLIMRAEPGTIPSGASLPAGVVYSYMDVGLSNGDGNDFSTINMRFKVTKSWVTTNNVDHDTIALYRYNSGWEKLTTTETNEDSSYYYYEASTPGFSIFAVGAEKIDTGTTGPTNTTDTPPPEVNTTETPAAGSDLVVPTGSEDSNLLLAVVVIIIAVVVAFFYFFRVKPEAPYVFRKE